MKPRGGLGRGLAALLPVGEVQLRQVDIDLVVPNPRQPRERMDPDALAELAESIRLHGVLQPIVVSEVSTAPGRPPTYQIIAGERRWQASKLAGMERIPVVVKEATEQQILEWALVENIQRADLGPLEEAAAFRQLLVDFGMTQEAVAERVGRHRSSVANTLRLLRLPESVKGMLASGELSEGHARALLAIEDTAVLEAMARRAVVDRWTVRQTEEAARQPQPQKPRKAAGQRDADVEWRALENRFRDALGTRVDLARGQKGGRLVIHFYSDDDLDGLIRLLNIAD